MQPSRRHAYIVLILSLSCILVPSFLTIRFFVRQHMVLNVLTAVPRPPDARQLPYDLTYPEYMNWTPCRGPYHMTATTYFRTYRSREEIVAFYRDPALQSEWQLRMDGSTRFYGSAPWNQQVTFYIEILPEYRYASPSSALETAINAATQEGAMVFKISSNYNYEPIWRPSCSPPSD
jgi:hypothetical protein